MKGFWLSEWYSSSCLLPQFKFRNSVGTWKAFWIQFWIANDPSWLRHQHTSIQMGPETLYRKGKTELKCTELPVEYAQKWTLRCTVSCMMSLRNPDKRQRNLGEFRRALVSLGLCNRACWSWVLLYMVISVLSGVTSMAFCSAWIPFLRPKYYGCSSVCVLDY